MTHTHVTCPLDNIDIPIEITFDLDAAEYPHLNLNAPELVAHMNNAHADL